MTPAATLKREEAKAKREALEKACALALRAHKLDGGMVKQYRFQPVREWRADFAWPEHMVMLEVDGGTFSQGRHTRGKGFEEDCIKRNTATLAGWKVFNVTSALIRSGAAIEWIKQAIGR
jgi:very-short-patch-repair endonuclease